MSNKAFFFDRDGTLNVEVGYLYEIDKFKWIDGAVEAIKFCNDNRYLVIVVTNQSGIARGFYSETEVQQLHQYMNEELAHFNAHIDAFYYCPHHPQGTVDKYRLDCDCRKPKPKMIEDACRDYNIDKTKSFMIGDALRDVECAKSAGLKSVLFTGGNLFEVVKGILSD